MNAEVYPNVGVDPALAPEGWIDIPLTVSLGLGGYRLDRFLKARIKRLSRARIQTIIERGQVRREGQILDRASIRVRAGDRLVLRRPAPPEPPTPMHYDVLYEDEALLVLDKPAGLPVHPSARYHRHTLTALMRERLGPDHGWEMAHRLDRETSGVLVFGRSRRTVGAGALASASTLKRAFAQRTVEKVYLGLARGTVAEPLSIRDPLGPDSDSEVRIKMGIRSIEDGGLSARTDVEPLAHGSFREEPITLVRCQPHSGRQHQIRVHLAARGHGLLGDKLYGIDEQHFIDVVDHGRPMDDLEAMLGLSRHALHAAELTLEHPGHGGTMTFRAPWPRPLAEILPVPARFASPDR
jgi:23S rRNA pseudouridine1911/1915/1917 synthase